jgi:hypothetical protein
MLSGQFHNEKFVSIQMVKVLGRSYLRLCHSKYENEFE